MSIRRQVRWLVLGILLATVRMFVASDSGSTPLHEQIRGLAQKLQANKELEAQARETLGKAQHILTEARQQGDKEQAEIAQQAIATAQATITKTKQNRESLELAFADACARARKQWLQDRDAVERQSETIEMGQKELEQWTAQNEEAQFNALKDSLNLLANGSLAYMAEADNAINGLSGAIKKYESELAKQGRSVDPLQYRKLEDLNRRRLRLLDAAESAKRLQKKKEKIGVAWDTFQLSAKTMDDEAPSFEKALVALSEDPFFRPLMDKEVLMPLVNKTRWQALFPKKPYLINMADFIVDYGYDATQWQTSRRRILQQYHLADQELAAVKALKHQVEETAGALSLCPRSPDIAAR